MKFKIVFSSKVEEKFKLKVFDMIRKENIPYIQIKELPHYLTENEINKIDATHLIVVNIHSLFDHPKRFCVHPCGNWNERWPNKIFGHLGGEEKKLAVSSGILLKSIYLSLLKNNTLPEYKVDIECTHHGPHSPKPIVFLEIGCSPEEWENEESNKIILNVLKEVISGIDLKAEKNIIALGGEHYMKHVSSLLRTTKIIVTHMCPSNQLHTLTEEMLLEAVHKSKEPVDFFLIDLPAVGQHHERLVSMLTKNNLSYQYVYDL